MRAARRGSSQSHSSCRRCIATWLNQRDALVAAYQDWKAAVEAIEQMERATALADLELATPL